MSAFTDFISANGIFFYPIISFTIFAFIALWQSQRSPVQRHTALILNIFATLLCACSTYTDPIKPDWMMGVILFVLIAQSIYICRDPVRHYVFGEMKKSVPKSS